MVDNTRFDDMFREHDPRLVGLGRDGNEEISSGSGPTTLLPTRTTASLPGTTAVPITAVPSSTLPQAAPTTSQVPTSSTTSPTSTSTPTTTPTTTPTNPAFTFLEPVGGVVELAADGPFQTPAFIARFTVPVSRNEGAMWSRGTETTFAGRDVATGAVTVFDVDTGLVDTGLVRCCSG